MTSEKRTEMTNRCDRFGCLIVGWARKHYCPTCPSNTARPWLAEICAAESAFSTASTSYEYCLNGYDDGVSPIIDPGFEWHSWPGGGGELREVQKVGEVILPCMPCASSEDIQGR